MTENRLVFVIVKTNQQVGAITRDYIPRVGDNVQFREGVFSVKQVTFIEDNSHTSIHVEVAATKIPKVARQDNHGNW